MITYEWLYVLAGIFFAIWALLSALDRSNGKRWGNAAFWGLLAASFLFGSHLPPLANGVLVLALVGIAGIGGLGRSDSPTTTLEERLNFSQVKGNRLFIPALIVPFVAVAGTLAYNYTPLSGTAFLSPGARRCCCSRSACWRHSSSPWRGCGPRCSHRPKKGAACSIRSAGRRSCRRCSPRWARSSRWRAWAISSARWLVR